MSSSKKSPDDFTGVPDWLIFREDFTALEKLCYSRMRRYCLSEGFGWASQELLAKEMGCSVRKVRDCVRKFSAQKMVKIEPRPGSTNRFCVRIPLRFVDDWKEFQKKTHPEASEHSELYISSLKVLEAESAALEANFAGGEANPAESQLQTARKERKEEAREETNGRNNLAGELRSPGNSSLRSPFRIGVSFTEDLSETFLSPQLDNAPDAVTLPQPPVPEIVSQPAPMFVAGEPVPEDDVMDDGKTKEERLASAKMLAQMSEHKHEVTQQVKEDKKRAKNKRALENGELPKPKTSKPKLGGLLLAFQDLWLHEYRKKFPNDAIASSWTAKQGWQINTLVPLYSQEDIERAIRYFLRYWDVHQPRILKGTVQIPTLGLFVSMHERIVPESGRMFSALKAKMDYEEWSKKNPAAFRAPDDLQAAYDAALPALKAIGL